MAVTARRAIREKNKRIAELEAAARAAKARKPGEKKDKPEKVDDEASLAGGKKKYEFFKEDEDPSPDASGKFAKMLPKGHELLKAWNEDNPNKDDKLICWANFNLKGGCPFGKKCRASHKK